MKNKIIIKNKEDLKNIENINNTIFLELPIYHDDLVSPYIESNKISKSLEQIKVLVDKIIESKKIKTFFIYGSPLQLIKFDEAINKRLKFHYWISLDTNGFSVEKHGYLKHSHVGISLYSRDGSISNLNVKDTKFPHVSCSFCGKNVKDWGGKKHLMNIKGTGLSDVWKDFYLINKKKKDPFIKEINLNILDISKSNFDNKKLECPDEVKSRINSLTNNSVSFLKIDSLFINKINNTKKITTKNTDKIFTKISSNLINKVILGDCIVEMEKLSKKYPNGIFDMVFADPPYNLSKEYREYDDTKKDEEYELWCNKWLELMVKLTKKDGSIFVVNIPKWSLSHAKFLNKHAYLRNWIVWDALSTPKGKIMPAHYSLLYYTKDPNTKVSNDLEKIDPINYCLRSSCLKDRSNDERYNKDKKEVSDIWYDIYRIKHKKDRDDHPCQLPHKLMDRIIELSTKEGDLIFDPFGGAGTTGLVALKKKRNYLLMELDPYYKDISEKWLSNFKINGETKRKSIKRGNVSIYTKKFLESKVQELSKVLKRKPTIEEFIKKFDLDLKEIEKLYGDTKKVLKAGRIAITNNRK